MVEELVNCPLAAGPMPIIIDGQKSTGVDPIVEGIEYLPRRFVPVAVEMQHGNFSRRRRRKRVFEPALDNMHVIDPGRDAAEDFRDHGLLAEAAALPAHGRLTGPRSGFRASP